MRRHNDAAAASSRTFDFLRNAQSQAILTGALTLIPVRSYPSWLRQGIIWAPTVIGAAGLAYLTVNPAAHRKLVEYLPKSERASEVDWKPRLESPRPNQPNRIRNVARAGLGGAVAGSAMSLVMAGSFWADVKLENGLRRLRVPCPRVVMGAAAGAIIWWQVNQENQRDK